MNHCQLKGHHPGLTNALTDDYFRWRLFNPQPRLVTWPKGCEIRLATARLLSYQFLHCLQHICCLHIPPSFIHTSPPPPVFNLLTRFCFLSLIWSWRHHCLFLIGWEPGWNPGNHQVAGSDVHFENQVFCICIFSELKKKKLYVNMFKTDTNSIKMLLRATVWRVFSVVDS